MSRLEVFRVSKIINAPLPFAYRWCTDFREDDYKMTGSTARRRFLERTKSRIIWVVKYKDRGRSMEGVRAVWLKRPNSWHLDTCGDGREIGDYTLTGLKNGKTRLDMVFMVTYDNPTEVESEAELAKGGTRQWSIYGRFLEKEYKKSLGARSRG